ncbi:MAG: VTT domain-containing protein [Eubacterium sp.]|nr:VTT domain-containing protein [Eubacterium sp.]
MKKIHENKWLQVVIIVLVFAVLLWATIKLFGNQLPQLLRLLKNGDEDGIAAYLNQEGAWKGMLSMLFLSMIQVFSIVIPGIIIQFTGGMIFPWWIAFIMCYTGFVVANTMVFVFARTFRKSVGAVTKRTKKKDSWIISTVNKYDPLFVFALAYLVPGIPNGIVPYFAASAKMSAREFFASVSVSSWIQILSNCVAGHFLIRGNIVMTIVSFAAQAALIILAGMNRKNILEKLGRTDTINKDRTAD